MIRERGCGNEQTSLSRRLYSSASCIRLAIPTCPWLIDSQPAFKTRELGHLHLYCPSSQLFHCYQSYILAMKVAQSVSRALDCCNPRRILAPARPSCFDRRTKTLCATTPYVGVPPHLPPLCFHGLTNCFSHKPFILKKICVAMGACPRSSELSALYCAFSCLGYLFSITYGLFSLSSVSLRTRVPLFSAGYRLFCKNTGGVGGQRGRGRSGGRAVSGRGRMRNRGPSGGGTLRRALPQHGQRPSSQNARVASARSQCPRASHCGLMHCTVKPGRNCISFSLSGPVAFAAAARKRDPTKLRVPLTDRCWRGFWRKPIPLSSEKTTIYCGALAKTVGTFDAHNLEKNKTPPHVVDDRDGARNPAQRLRDGGSEKWRM